MKSALTDFVLKEKGFPGLPRVLSDIELKEVFGLITTSMEPMTALGKGFGEKADKLMTETLNKKAKEVQQAMEELKSEDKRVEDVQSKLLDKIKHIEQLNSAQEEVKQQKSNQSLMTAPKLGKSQVVRTKKFTPANLASFCTQTGSVVVPDLA